MAISPDMFRTDNGDAQGGAIVPGPRVEGPFIHNAISTTGVSKLGLDFDTSDVPENRFTIFGGTPTFTRQSEQGAAKSVTNGETSKVTFGTDTYAAITIYALQAIKQMVADPRKVMTDKLALEMGVQVESEVLGIYRKDATHTSGFTTPLRTIGGGLTTTWEATTGLLGFADALATASAEIEERDYIATGALVGRGLSNSIRTTRAVTTIKDDAELVTGYQESPTNLFSSISDFNPDLDRGVQTTINLKDPLAAADGDIVAIVGNWSLFAVRMYTQLNHRLSLDATVVDGDANTVNTFQDNAAALRSEFDMGGGCIDSDAFQLVVKNV